MADLYAVAVAVHRPRGADDAVRNGVDRCAARRGKIGASVGDAPWVRLAELCCDAPVAVQRAAEIKTGQPQLCRRVAAALRPHIGIKRGSSLLVGFFRGIGHGGLGLCGGLLGGQGAVGIQQGGFQLALRGVQGSLLALQLCSCVLSAAGGVLGLGAGLLQCSGLGVKLGQHGTVFGAHLAQHGVKGQQLVQAFGLCQQPERPAAVQPLHCAQLLLADGKACLVLRLLGVPGSPCGFRVRQTRVQLCLCLLHGSGYRLNLPRQLGGLSVQ